MKARLFLLLALILGTSGAFAGEPLAHLSLRCETPWPTTSTTIETRDSRIVMDIKFHYGSGKIPLRMDSVSPDDLSIVQSNAELVKSLDQTQRFEWNLSQCTGRAGGLFRCHSGKQIQAEGSAGLKVDQVLFFTTRVSEQQILSNRTRYMVELWLTVGSTVLRVFVPYDQKDCMVQHAFRDAEHVPDSIRTHHSF